VASGLLSGEAEEGGGALVLVVGGAQVRSTAVSSGRLVATIGEERGEARDFRIDSITMGKGGIRANMRRYPILW
jgi:hypothetical protein